MMLGKTAGGLFWMFRNLERAENTARLIEAGFRIALTRSTDATLEWQSVILTTAATFAFESKYDTYEAESVIDFLLRDRGNPNSVLSVINSARDNAKTVRTALTSEVWVAVNETWMILNDRLKTPVEIKDLPGVLSLIRHQSALVRGALHGTMLRNEIYDFCRLGTYVERFDNTARIIDVKYYTLLPQVSDVGGQLDNVQWETILRSVSAHRSYRWAVEDDFTGPAITDFLILDNRMPRSLVHCLGHIVKSISYLAEGHGNDCTARIQAQKMEAALDKRDIESIFEEGLHEFLEEMLADVATLSVCIEADFQFNAV